MNCTILDCYVINDMKSLMPWRHAGNQNKLEKEPKNRTETNWKKNLNKPNRNKSRWFRFNLLFSARNKNHKNQTEIVHL